MVRVEKDSTATTTRTTTTTTATTTIMETTATTTTVVVTITDLEERVTDREIITWEEATTKIITTTMEGRDKTGEDNTEVSDKT